MFKKIILALVCLSFTFSGFAAKLTATLQSGDKITPFYGDSAYIKAYNAAVSGDIITLSPGEFKVTDIEKSITVIGTYAFSEDLSEATTVSQSLTISANNVTLEGIRFTNFSNRLGLVIKGADNLTINRCYIALLNDEEKTEHKYHNNTIFTDCYIGSFQAMSLSQNTVLRNCSVHTFYDKNEIDNPALIERCNVSRFAYYDTFLNYYQPYAIYRNCRLGLFKTYHNEDTPSLSFSAPSEFHNNYFEETYQKVFGNSYAKSWTIQYGSTMHSGNINNRIYSNNYFHPLMEDFSPYTKDSISYGPIAHKAYPTIPSITSSEIDTKTDANGNLHVKITATARD